MRQAPSVPIGLLFLCSFLCKRRLCRKRIKKALRNPLLHKALQGGAEEARTPDLCIANAALSQLSYRPVDAPELSTGDTRRVDFTVRKRLCQKARTRFAVAQALVAPISNDFGCSWSCVSYRGNHGGMCLNLGVSSQGGKRSAVLAPCVNFRRAFAIGA